MLRVGCGVRMWKGFNEPNVDEWEVFAHFLSNSVGDMGYLVMDVIQPCGG